MSSLEAPQRAAYFLVGEALHLWHPQETPEPIEPINLPLLHPSPTDKEGSQDKEGNQDGDRPVAAIVETAWTNAALPPTLSH